MSRPFDDTSAWWRDELRELAPIVHNGHAHEVKEGTWSICPRASCSRIRAILDESKHEIDTVDVPSEDLVFVRIRRKEKR